MPGQRTGPQAHRVATGEHGRTTRGCGGARRRLLIVEEHGTPQFSPLFKGPCVCDVSTTNWAQSVRLCGEQRKLCHQLMSLTSTHRTLVVFRGEITQLGSAHGLRLRRGGRRVDRGGYIYDWRVQGPWERFGDDSCGGRTCFCDFGVMCRVC